MTTTAAVGDPARAFVAGGFAGLSVDVALHPLDTLKTRLQSPHGFADSGGFRGVYQGVSAAAAGSVWSAGLFFVAYEAGKPRLRAAATAGSGDTLSLAAADAASASMAEVVACLVRVPTEVVKQRMQIGAYASLRAGALYLWTTEGARGFYRGFGTTVLRDTPFAVVQFPLYEIFKRSARTQLGVARVEDLPPFVGAACGAVAGMFAAAATTPLDVAKTRIMLHSSSGDGACKLPTTVSVMRKIAASEGPPALWKGVYPRTMWMGLGGFVFFGAYEFASWALRT